MPDESRSVDVLSAAVAMLERVGCVDVSNNAYYGRDGDPSSPTVCIVAGKLPEVAAILYVMEPDSTGDATFGIICELDRGKWDRARHGEIHSDRPFLSSIPVAGTSWSPTRVGARISVPGAGACMSAGEEYFCRFLSVYADACQATFGEPPDLGELVPVGTRAYDSAGRNESVFTRDLAFRLGVPERR